MIINYYSSHSVPGPCSSGIHARELPSYFSFTLFHPHLHELLSAKTSSKSFYSLFNALSKYLHVPSFHFFLFACYCSTQEWRWRCFPLWHNDFDTALANIQVPCVLF